VTDQPKGRLATLFGHLYFQVILGTLLGILVGFLKPGLGEALKPLGDGFIKLIRMLLAPIIFGTIVVGIAKMGDLKKIGRVGIKALIYFEIVSTLALVIGLIVANVLKPGAGMNVDASTLDTKSLATYTSAAKQQDVTTFFMDMIPSTFAEAFVKGNMLPVIVIAVLTGFAVAQLAERGKKVVEAIDRFLQVLFEMVRIVMRLAPIGAFGAMAFTVGKYGVSSLKSLGWFVAGVYFTTVCFIVVVLGGIAWLNRVSLWRFLKYIKEEIIIVFATCSTEAVLPRMMVKLEELGCARPVVGLVLPAGYTFNADGTAIYLSMAALFVAQATNTHLSLPDQLLILGVLLFTSKGSAGVAGAGFITLAATLASMDKIPMAGLALLLGVDRFVNAARAVTNLIGNGIATITVARWERAYDEKRASALLDGKVKEQGVTA
jgi:aerobic C4-dicarboxylate transport protein